MKNLFIFVVLFLTFNALAEGAPTTFAVQIEDLERAHGGSIGVAATNLEDGKYLEYRANERFAMCSTFKLLLVGAVLSHVDSGEERLSRSVEFTQADILEHAPITKQHLNENKMSIAELCAATLQYSDNTAANLLLRSIGGPKSLTGYIRSLNDKVTRIDRTEPTLNSNNLNDLRDTTTPSAMVKTMQKLLVGNSLSQQSREKLNTWLVGNKTGDKKLRAGIPPSWRIGDKTGAGNNGASSDVAIAWPTDKKPFLVAVYYTGSSTSTDEKNKIIAKVGRIVSKSFYPE